MSDENLEIYRLLTRIQKELIAPKDQTNAHQGWGYRRVEDILAAAKPFLPEGAYFNLSDEVVCIEGWHYVKATASFCYMGKFIYATGFAREPLEEITNAQKGTKKQLPQTTASCSTYARKIALTGLLAIDGSTEKEVGEYSSKPFDEIDARDNNQLEIPKISGERALRIAEMITKLGANRAKLLEKYHIQTFNDLTDDSATHLENSLKKKLTEIKGSEYARV